MYSDFEDTISNGHDKDISNYDSNRGQVAPIFSVSYIRSLQTLMNVWQAAEVSRFCVRSFSNLVSDGDRFGFISNDENRLISHFHEMLLSGRLLTNFV